MVDWAERYRPRSLKEVAGNPTALRELETWARAWEKGVPKKKAVILAGEPGVGKTSAAHALAADLKWAVVEMNASDARNAESVRRIATRGALSETFTSQGEYIRSGKGERKLIILDEADNLAGREDSGGVAAIADTIRKTGQPIVLIVNDLYELTRRSSTLKSLAQVIKFQRISLPATKAALRRVVKAEGVEVPEEVLDYIAERSRGDLRSAINDLQAITEGKERVSGEDLMALGPRDIRGEVFGALLKIFRSGKAKEALGAAEDLDEDPERLILWVDENLPYEYTSREDLAAGYAAVSRADQYLGRVRRRQRYGFWSYALDMMTAGVSVARSGRHGGGQYRFPLWLSKMSRSRSVRGTINSICLKLGRYLHTTSGRVRRDVLPALTTLYREDPDFRKTATAALALEAKEVAFLLDEEEDSQVVKQLMDEANASGPGVKARPFSSYEGSGA
jgi:replication factor C large subunit